MRPVRNQSQTVALLNQLLDRDTVQADSIPLDKSEQCHRAARPRIANPARVTPA